MEFKLKAEFIELDNLLKILEFATSGAQAREQIQAGRVKVNGQVESRIRRKLCPGDCVEFSGQKVSIVA